MQQAIPAQTAGNVPQKSQDHRRANTLQTVHATDEAGGGHCRIGIAKRDRDDRETTLSNLRFAKHGGRQVPAALSKDVFKFDQFMTFLRSRGCTWKHVTVAKVLVDVGQSVEAHTVVVEFADEEAS